MSLAIDPELVSIARHGAAFVEGICARAGSDSAGAGILISTLIASFASRIPSTYQEALEDARKLFGVDIDASEGSTASGSRVFDATGCAASCIAARVFAELVKAAESRPGSVWVDEEATA